MQIILSLAITLSLGLAMLQSGCDKSKTGNTETAKRSANSSAAPIVNTNSSAAAPVAHQDDAPRITLAEAKKEFDAGNAIFVDSRPAESYNVEHVKGSINVPFADAETRYKEIPTGKKIIVYCS